MSSEPINKIIAYCWAYVIPCSIAYIGGTERGTNWSICPGNIPAVNECVCMCVCVCVYVCVSECVFSFCITVHSVLEAAHEEWCLTLT